jgi:hypothetical protein
MTTPDGNTAIPRKRFAPLPSRNAQIASFATRFALACLALAAAALAVAALRPLDREQPTEPLDLPTLPEPTTPNTATDPATEQRSGVAKRLAASNAFSMIRAPLAQRPTDAPTATAANNDDTPDAPPPPETTADRNDTNDPATPGRVIEVADADDAEPAVKASIESIKLFGLYGANNDQPGIIAGFVHDRRPDDPRFISEGQRFAVPAATSRNANPQALEWTLTAVDRQRHRALLTHQGTTYALALFGDADTAPLTIDNATPNRNDRSQQPDTPRERVADDGTVVVERDPADVIRQLRDAGEDASIEELFELMNLGDAANPPADNEPDTEPTNDADQPNS